MQWWVSVNLFVLFSKAIPLELQFQFECNKCVKLPCNRNVSVGVAHVCSLRMMIIWKVSVVRKWKSFFLDLGFVMVELYSSFSAYKSVCFSGLVTENKILLCSWIPPTRVFFYSFAKLTHSLVFHNNISKTFSFLLQMWIHHPDSFIRFLAWCATTSIFSCFPI